MSLSDIMICYNNSDLEMEYYYEDKKNSFFHNSNKFEIGKKYNFIDCYQIVKKNEIIHPAYPDILPSTKGVPNVLAFVFLDINNEITFYSDIWKNILCQLWNIRPLSGNKD